MIKFIHINIETPIILKEDSPILLILENSSDFYNKVLEFKESFENTENNISLFINDELINPDKVGDIFYDFFNFDINSKKNLNLLYKKLEEHYFETDLIVKLNEINSKIFSFSDNLTSDFPFLLDFKDLSINDFFKSINLKFSTQYNSLLEKIINYINVLIELKNISFLIFVNIKSVLTDEEMKQLYYHCKNKKLSLLLIESAKIRPLLTEEKAIIITEDLCEILENFEDF